MRTTFQYMGRKISITTNILFTFKYFYDTILLMNRTLKLTSIAMLTAMSIVTNLFTITLSGTNAMSFTIAICFFTGIYFGPLAAATVGFAGDLIAHFIPIGPTGAYNVFIALSTTLFGVICALVYKIKLPKLVKWIVAAVICYVVCLCGLNTLGLWMTFKAKVPPTISGLITLLTMDKTQIDTSFWAYLGSRALWSAINIVINVVVVALLQQSRVIEKITAKLRNSQEQETEIQQDASAINEDDNC